MKRFVHFLVPFEPRSAGIRVIHYLAALTRAAGYENAVTSPCGYDPDLPLVTNVSEIDPENDIAIYPEIIPAGQNPLGCRNVIRYMLYYPKAWFAPGASGKSIPAHEMVVPYHEDYFAETQAHYAGQLSKEDILCLPMIEPELFHANGHGHIENVVYTGKEEVAAWPEFETQGKGNDVVITRSWPMKRETTAAILRAAINLYSLDHHSAILDEAVLCGCYVFLVQPDGSPQPYRPSHDPEEVVMQPERDTALVKAWCAKAQRFFGAVGTTSTSSHSGKDGDAVERVPTDLNGKKFSKSYA